MADGDEDDDYMSDKFLSHDTQPGLVPEIFARKRSRQETGKKKARQHNAKSMKVKEAEGREEKLSKSIDESNKGFAMLSKMGFKKGMGLGKQLQGRTEPIPVDLKLGRKGLGKEEEDKRNEQKRHMALVMRAKQKRLADATLKVDFKERQRKKEIEYQMRKDYFKSQKCCEQLDSAKGLEMPFPWAWPSGLTKGNKDGEGEGGTCEEKLESGVLEKEVEEEEEEEEEEETLEDVELHLDELTNYLRTTHNYCVWCGTAYNDVEDFNTNCPGGGHRGHEDS